LLLQKKLFLIIVFFLTTSLFSSQSSVINFAPLPTKKASKNIEELLPISSYLSEKLSIDIKYVYKKDYQDILDGFKDGTIDIAYLGPLPFISLKREYKYVEPIITFKQKNGSSSYRCVLSKFKDDELNTSKQIKVALTQPLSTCGYLMSKMLLKNEFDIELEKQKYDYTMTHTNALISVLRGDFLIAGAKENIAKRFESLGMEIIATSEPLPGFSLVVNTKTLSKKQINDIQKTLLNTPKEVYETWEDVTSYGFIKADFKDYDTLNVDFSIPKYGNIE